MASFDYASMRNTATRLLNKFGNPFVLKKPDGAPKYNPKTKTTEAAYKDFPGICVMKPYSDEAMGALSNIIQAGDVEFVCTMNNISVVPKPDQDKVVYNGIVYNVISIKSIDPAGNSVIVHFLQCRKAGGNK